MSAYRTVYQRVWGDAKFIALSDRAKLLWFHILTGPHANGLPGIYFLPEASVAGNLRWTLADAGRHLAEIEESGMAEVDRSAGVIFLPNFLRYNKPGSPKNLIHWIRSLDSIPESHLHQKWIDQVRWHYTQIGATSTFDGVLATEYTPSDTPSNGPSDTPSDAAIAIAVAIGKGEEGRESAVEAVGADDLFTQAAPEQRPPGQMAWENWIMTNEELAQADDVPRGVFARFSMKLLEEFQHYYDTHSKGGRMTDRKIGAFVKRVTRVPFIRALYGMEVYLDGYSGMKPWEYCATIMTDKANLSEREFGAEVDRHRRRYRETSIFAEIMREKHEHESIPSVDSGSDCTSTEAGSGQSTIHDQSRSADVHPLPGV